MTAELPDEPQSQLHWFGVGMRNLVSLPAFILTMSCVGFAALAAESGIPVGQAMFMTAGIWALPAQVILVGSILSDANIVAAFIAVTLSSVRMMPMVAALIPSMRGPRTPTWLLLIVSHFIAITAWVFAMKRIHDVPRDGRVAFFAGFGLTLTATNTLVVGLLYSVVGSFPPIVSACLFFLTPVYFLTSIWVSAGHKVIYWALGAGLLFGYIFAIIAPQYDILLAGLIGGTLAWAGERAWRKREVRS